MTISTALLEEKYRRSRNFGKYLDEQADQSPLAQELKKSLTLYRIALCNVLQDRLPKPPKKKRGK